MEEGELESAHTEEADESEGGRVEFHFTEEEDEREGWKRRGLESLHTEEKMGNVY